MAEIIGPAQNVAVFINMNLSFKGLGIKNKTRGKL